ncbi:UDP-D-xylose:L-fucose alpha-1,3-D-xylosyltransferase MGP4-like [Patiria miniata]|uniref:Nucleotide-diphospho-sugar transferase domain-containing protein n=1 Tax=Patiria miniata TaxID=46514 RepID=A0A914B9X6_PATMI|nr:UDP-D-xylose:L-fucose alpha-1,3-D-xylosyltransferase MGP4-like [Patiria miniata]
MALTTLFKFLSLLLLSSFIISISNYYQTVTVLEPSINLSGGGADEWDENDLRKSPSGEAIGGRITETRGRLSDCTPADIRARRPGVMILATTNTAFLDMTLNMLESIRRIRLCVNTTIIAEDRRVYEYLHQLLQDDPGIHVRMTNSGETGGTELTIHTRHGYYGLFNKRQAYILALLEQALEVLFTDTDTYWFGDPLPYFHGEFDMYMVDLDAQDTNCPPMHSPPRVNFCAGFVHFKPTKVTLQFVKAWIRQMAAKRDANREGGHTMPDQVFMNNLIRDGKPVQVKVKSLDSNLFPWGTGFYASLAHNKNHSAVVMHAAGIRGHKAKVDRFREAGMWLVNDTSEGLIDKWVV